MSENKHYSGPSRGLFSQLQRIMSLIMRSVTTRINLAAIELEEARIEFLQLLLLAGIALLCFAFGLMTLLTLLYWVIPIEYRLMTLTLLTISLFSSALLCALLTLHKARKATLLKETRQQLRLDKILLDNEE